jgi:uncharacterized membrane protein
MTLPSFNLPMSVVSRKRLSFLCAVILVVFLALLFGWAGREGLFAVPAKNNQQFSELYFTDTKAIPPHVVTGQRYSVPFAIVNHEGRTQTYSYNIQITAGSKTTISENMTVEIAPGERAIRSAPFSAHDASQPIKVTIELVNKQQTITFRIPR